MAGPEDLLSRLRGLDPGTTFRLGFQALVLILFFLPWVAFEDTVFSGLSFRDFAAAVAAAGTAPQVAPITWDLTILQPAAALGAIYLGWRGRNPRAGDFLAGFAAFVGPIALIMVSFEVPAARLLPAAYASFALAAAVLLLDFRFGRPQPPDG